MAELSPLTRLLASIALPAIKAIDEIIDELGLDENDEPKQETFRDDNFEASVAEGVAPADPANMPLVILESPFAGDVAGNEAYARKALRDCLLRGEAPIASHLLYTQVLDDSDEEQRRKGIEAGLAWRRGAHRAVFYADRGFSAGMLAALTIYAREQFAFEIRLLDGSKNLHETVTDEAFLIALAAAGVRGIGLVGDDHHLVADYSPRSGRAAGEAEPETTEPETAEPATEFTAEEGLFGMNRIRRNGKPFASLMPAMISEQEPDGERLARILNEHW